jgi:CRISPR-associated endonuclease/helicase Cas3
MMIYYAHSAKGEIPAQEYAHHVSGVYDRICGYLEDIGRYATLDRDQLVDATKKAALYHDLGKLNKDNQTVLAGRKRLKALPRNHVDAGAAYLLNESHFSAVAAAAVQAHHIGFPDFSSEQNRGECAFRDERIMADVDQELSELETIHNQLIQTHFTFGNEQIKGDRSIFLRMLLSCLADADHTDTAVHYRKYPVYKEVIPLRAAERLRCLDQYVAGLTGGTDERDALRKEMYSACRDKDIHSDASSCDSPVGSGKTTAVMAHLLAQAARRGLRRIFVVLPFTNIIRQSVQTYREALVLPGENAEDVVAELHHRADFESEDVRHLTALWRAPVIVTTAVAFFETLASNSTATLRRLHELPGSAVFVDESHAALPAALLALAWKWIQVYAKEWNCYWVLASGSLNRFWEISEIAGEGDRADVPEIVDETLRARLSTYEHGRVPYRSDLRPKNDAELADWIARFHGPRLLILNTVQSAAIVASRFRERFGREHVEHLSTALTPADRECTLQRVIRRLKTPGDEDWTLVATSCVEAGVNLSFRNGFRELGSLVSLLQAAGRVNREGLYNDSEIWTFCIAEDEMLKTNPGIKNAAAVLKRYFERGDVICPELSTRSIREEIAQYGLSGKHTELVKREELSNFPWIEKEFRVIDTDTRIVVADLDVIEKIRHGQINWRDLQKVSVQIAKYKLDELRTPIIMDDIYGWNLDYDNFLGYMAGIIALEKFAGEGLII